jgi:ligand-binding sensor domain-containing protein
LFRGHNISKNLFVFSVALAILLSAVIGSAAYPTYQNLSRTLANQYTEDDQFYIDYNFILNQWRVEDGLPVNTTTKILKGQKGYLWIGTTDGLVRFDGIDFTVYKTAEYPGLPSNRILDLKKTYDGTIWLGTDKGELVKFSDGEFKEMTPADGLNGNRYSSLYIDSNERLWVGTEKGISTYQDGELSQFYPHKIKGHIVRIYRGTGKDVWYVDEEDDSIYRFDCRQSSLIFEKDEGINPFLTLQEDGLLFGADKNIYRYINGKLTSLEFPNFKISDLYQSANGTIIAATENNGLYELKEGSWIQKNKGVGWRMGGEVLKRYAGSRMYVTRHRVYKDELLLANFESRITGYYFDRENNLWFTTNRSGLVRLKPNPFDIYGTEEALGTSNINSIIERSNGEIWIGTFGAGPAKLKDGNIKSLFDYESVENGTTPDQKYVLSMVERNNGTFLMSILGHGMYRFYDDRGLFRQVKVPFLDKNQDGSLNVRTLFDDSRNRLWAGTNIGLWIKQGENWRKIDINSNFNYPVRYITEAPDSSLWMATNGGGIIHYKNNQIEVYNETEGLSSNLIRSIYIDSTENPSNYTLYVGSEDVGLNRISIRDGVPNWETHTVFTKNNGLYSNGVHQIIEDNQQRLWMSSNQGVF